MRSIITTLFLLAGVTAAAATINDMSLTNQYGEKSQNQIVSVSANGGATIGAAIPTANVTAKLLTGLGAGTNAAIASTDTILEAFAKLQNQLNNKAVVVECAAGSGGAASEALTCTGLATTDTILAVTQRVAGSNNVAIIGYSTLITNGLTVTYTANPGAGSVIRVLVKH